MQSFLVEESRGLSREGPQSGARNTGGEEDGKALLLENASEPQSAKNKTPLC